MQEVMQVVYTKREHRDDRDIDKGGKEMKYERLRGGYTDW